MKMAGFIGMMFLARDVAHSVHLSTRSYAKHKALQEFYEGIVGLVDGLAEAYQGRNGLIGIIPLQSSRKSNNIVEFLQAQLAEIESNRYEVIDKSDTALQNIVDEIVGLYLSTIYKLRFLA
jgi:23S rRNA maturation-related 3'-5' exoribonuclease YhaM